MRIEIWYMIQASREDDEDWYQASSQTFDSLTGDTGARCALLAIQNTQGFKFRIVKTTITEEVVV
jgi:hypothetical protein